MAPPEVGVKAPVLGFGELVVERGRSRLGRVEEVGVTMAWEGVRRKEDVSRGVAMVDMVGGRRDEFAIVVYCLPHAIESRQVF